MRRRTVLGSGLALAAAGLLPRLADAAPAAEAAGSILDRLHALRRERRLPELRLQLALMDMARRQAWHMHRLGFLTHVGPDGSNPPERMQQTGYGGYICGEVLAETPGEAAGAIDLWLADAETRTVLLDPEARETGIFGVRSETGVVRWALVLATGTS